MIQSNPTAPKPKMLEVIVSSLEDAMEAEAGGADRLEVVRDLAVGGLTPDLELVTEIRAAVRIPIRVMLRESASMSLASVEELEVLRHKAAAINRLGVDGLVMGFVLNNELDVDTLSAITASAPQLRVTFHRAFDELPDPLRAIQTLKLVPPVDRILTTGGPGGWAARKLRLHYWQKCARPEITILAGAGLLEPVIRDLGRDHEISEMHVGRAARIPQETDGKVSRAEVERIKGFQT